MPRILTSICLATLLVVVSASTSGAGQYHFQYQKIFETGPNAQLDLSYFSGNVRVVSGMTDQIIVEATKTVDAVDQSEAELVADHVEIKSTQAGESVRIQTNYLQMRNKSSSFWKKLLGIGGSDSNGRVDWEIQVPINCQIMVSNTEGLIDISDIHGQVSVKSRSGSMVISRVFGPVTISSSYSDIQLNELEGGLDVSCTSGRLTGELLFGPVTVQQAEGSIELKFVEGDVRISSNSANIDIRQDRGSLDLATSNGSVNIFTNLDSSKDFFVETESGNINLTIPGTSSGNLRILSQTGEIKTDIPISIQRMSRKQVEGSFGVGGVEVNLISITGDVAVAQF